jgi:hypothetical protein
MEAQDGGVCREIEAERSGAGEQWGWVASERPEGWGGSGRNHGLGKEIVRGSSNAVFPHSYVGACLIPAVYIVPRYVLFSFTLTSFIKYIFTLL